MDRRRRTEAAAVEHTGSQVSQFLALATNLAALGLQAGEHLLHRVLGGRLIVNQQHGQPDQVDVMLPKQVG